MNKEKVVGVHFLVFFIQGQQKEQQEQQEQQQRQDTQTETIIKWRQRRARAKELARTGRLNNSRLKQRQCPSSTETAAPTS